MSTGAGELVIARSRAPESRFARRGARRRGNPVLLLVAFLFLCSCNSSSSAVVTGRFKTGAQVTPNLKLEVAATNTERQKGLMFRKEMGELEGMLFVFPKEEVLRFWMKNTYIPLDMIFVSKDKKVTGIVRDATPLTETSRSVEVPSTYVVELNAGEAKKLGIDVGSVLEIEGDFPRAL